MDAPGISSLELVLPKGRVAGLVLLTEYRRGCEFVVTANGCEHHLHDGGLDRFVGMVVPIPAAPVIADVAVIAVVCTLNKVVH
jgi:hypothetical protein